MTGEISLRGLVLPVGGIKEKVLAAMRAGIRRVMLPARNRKDLEEVPAEAKEKIEFAFLQDVDEAVRAVLEPRPEAKTPAVYALRYDPRDVRAVTRASRP